MSQKHTNLMVGLTHCQIVVTQVYLLLYFGVNETVVTEN